MTEQRTELVKCWRCGGLDRLRELCGVCNGLGSLRQPIEEGHETLSSLRSRAGDDPHRYKTTDATQPSHNDPLWAGHEPR